MARVQCRSSGPPANEPENMLRVCRQLLPNHGGVAAQPGNGGYFIDTDIPRSGSTGFSYTAGQTYTGKSSLAGNTSVGETRVAARTYL